MVTRRAAFLNNQDANKKVSLTQYCYRSPEAIPIAVEVPRAGSRSRRSGRDLPLG